MGGVYGLLPGASEVGPGVAGEGVSAGAGRGVLVPGRSWTWPAETRKLFQSPRPDLPPAPAFTAVWRAPPRPAAGEARHRWQRFEGPPARPSLARHWDASRPFAGEDRDLFLVAPFPWTPSCPRLRPSSARRPTPGRARGRGAREQRLVGLAARRCGRAPKSRHGPGSALLGRCES